MKNVLFLTAVCLFIYCGKANAQFKYDVLGRPYTEMTYTDVEGDPYLATYWTPGKVTLQNDKSVATDLKYDTYDNVLIFKGKDDQAMELTDKLNSFSLTHTSNDISNMPELKFVKGFPPVEKQDANTWYQLIGDGKVKLLKCYKKTITQSKAFNSATVTKSFNSFQVYYVYRDNQLTELSLSKKSVLKLLSDHSAQVEAYLKTDNVNLKSDTDLQKLFTYYNTLN